MTMEQNWRDHLSVPPRAHTLPEIMRTIILMAAEDARALDLESGQSARAEFREKVGYDLYETAFEFLSSPIFTAVDGQGEPTLPSDAGVMTLLDPPEGEH